jgi:hypothetical protein
MTNKMRTTIAALMTALFLGAMSTAGVLTHSHSTPVVANKHAGPPAAMAPRANRFSDGESITND